MECVIHTPGSLQGPTNENEDRIVEDFATRGGKDGLIMIAKREVVVSGGRVSSLLLFNMYL